MNTVRLTSDNARQYIGHQIIFRTKNEQTLKLNYIIKEILSVSDSGNSVEIDYPALDNRLQIITRDVYVLL